MSSDSAIQQWNKIIGENDNNIRLGMLLHSTC